MERVITHRIGLLLKVHQSNFLLRNKKGEWSVHNWGSSLGMYHGLTNDQPCPKYISKFCLDFGVVTALCYGRPSIPYDSCPKCGFLKPNLKIKSVANYLTWKCLLQMWVLAADGTNEVQTCHLGLSSCFLMHELLKSASQCICIHHTALVFVFLPDVVFSFC